MGLLDEAIREHLELKRRRGADGAEVTRQEREAFGPPARDEAVATAPPPEAPAEPRAALDEPASFAAEEPRAEPPPEPTRLHVADTPPEPHGDPADEFPPAPSAPPTPEAPEAPEAPAQRTREFDLDEVRAATGSEPEIVPADEEPEAEAEDVLEETPEFLQETPEHDRLWFEQRPPRDFDF